MTNLIFFKYIYYNPLHVHVHVIKPVGSKDLYVNSFSTCAPDGHLLRVTMPDAVFDLLRMNKILLETRTCKGL